MKKIKRFYSNTNAKAATGFVPTYEHLNDTRPINSDGSCSHPFLFPNSDKTLCILPERVDVGKHYILTGGVEGKKEFYQKMVDRVSSYGAFIIGNEIEKFPDVIRLFNSPKFQSSAKRICPVDKSYLDPFNLVL